MQELAAGCTATCPKSCKAALDVYLSEYKLLTGYSLDGKQLAKLENACARRCNQECIKGGNAYDFVVAYRKY
jgi:hypothetical protein